MLRFEIDDDKVKAMIDKTLDNVDDVIEDALTIYAEKTVADAKRNAPVDTGYMEANIDYKQDGNKVEILSPAPYSMYVEFGTVKMSPQPFFYPAIEKNKPLLLKAIKEGLL
jgi:HK97 gp10 family phage protein